jgi:hypothetical protein
VIKFNCQQEWTKKNPLSGRLLAPKPISLLTN